MSTSQPGGKRLPVKSSLENLRKRAKQRARGERVHLTEAQHRVARDYGFDSWAALVAHVASLRDRSESWRRDASANLPKAANAGDLETVRALLAAGGVAQHDLDLALARAVLRFGERREIAELLVAHGADPDGQYGSDYGPIVFVTGECLDADGLQFLIDCGADVGFAPIDTKYGKHCPLSYVLGSYVRGRNPDKHRAIEILLGQGAHIPVEVTPPVLAIHRGEAATLDALVSTDPGLVTRRFADLPYGNLPLAGATLLHCAVELGELACVDVLLERGADVNARADHGDGLGQTPIFHAINTVCDGNFTSLEHLASRLGAHVQLAVRATWPGQVAPVTPLEYAEQSAQLTGRGDHRPRIADELARLRNWPLA
jgi:hypothetical protein